jgi:hypothetical protein
MFRVLTIWTLSATLALPAIAQVNSPPISPSRNNPTTSSHSFTTTTDSSGNTHVQFGDGTAGQALPTGANNITGTYRVGRNAGKIIGRRH